MATEAGADEVNGSADPSEHLKSSLVKAFVVFPKQFEVLGVRLAWGDSPQCSIPKSL